MLDLERPSVPDASDHSRTGPLRLSRTEIGLAITGSVLLVAVASLVFVANPVPSEDASILFRYSANVAAGHGIVYNPAGPTVDGATDMLFMLALAGLNALGLSVELAAALVNAVSVGAFALLLYLAWRRWARVAVGWALIPVAVVLVGPVWQYGQLGYGTPTFAAACTVVAVVSEIAARDPIRRKLLLLGLVIGLAGLVRPEGFILAPLVLAAQALRTRSWRMLFVPTAVWLPTVAAFVGWRILYFGYPFPNPFYKKGGGTLHMVALPTMVQFVVQAGLPLVALLLLGLVVRASRRRALALVAILGGWAAAWLLMSNEMNLSFRFQYAVLPVLLVLCAPLYRELRQGVVKASMTVTRVGLAVLLVVTAAGLYHSAQTFLRPAVKSAVRQVSIPQEIRQNDPDVQVSEILNANAAGGRRVLATTEAGYVAWKSGWLVTDLWGLNDKAIAHNGYLDVAQLRQLSPEVVFAHVPTGNRQASTVVSADDFLPGWTSMTEPLLCYAHREGYVLLAQWGDDNSLVVLARPDLPDLRLFQDQFGALQAWGFRNSAAAGVLPTPAGCS